MSFLLGLAWAIGLHINYNHYNLGFATEKT